MESGPTAENALAPPPGGTFRRMLPAVLAIMLLAAGLRAWRLNEQSVWHDEYYSAVHVEAPDLATYMTLVRLYNPEHVPLYYLAEYGWARAVGTDPERLRWLSILFGALTVPLLCALGRRLFSPAAGLWAGLLFALSPAQLWHGQSLRPYALLVLAAAASMHTLVWAVQEGGVLRWLAHGAANILLMWTHPFGVLLLGGMAPAFLFMKPRRWRPFLLWAGFNAAVLFSVWVYFRTMPYVGEAAYAWFQMPDPARLLFDFAGDDALLRLDVRSDGATWPWVPAALAAVLQQARAASDWIIVAAGLAAMLWLGAGVRRKQPARHRMRAAFLLGILTIPMLVLLVLSVTVRPAVVPRYTVYSGLALYLALGGAAAGISAAGLRAAVLACGACVCALQLAFVLPAPTRTDWHGMFRYLSEQCGPRDLIATVGPLSTPELLYTYRARQSGFARPAETFPTLPVLCEKTRDFFAEAANADASVWVFYDQAYRQGPDARVVDCFSRQGYDVSSKEFVVQENLIVYRVRRGGVSAPQAADCRACALDDRVYEKLLAAAGVDRSDAAAWARATASLANTVDMELPPDKEMLAMVSVLLSDGGDADLGRRFAEASLRLAPEYGTGSLALGYALWRLGDAAGARTAFDRAFEQDPLMALYRPLMQALCESGLSERTRAEAKKLHKMGVDTPRFVLQ